ncbi:MAG: RNA polymerase factor sigma-54 [Firmicutes bacterium]|nr:RNA polymerase factor sigma-54 [Bacillota bacterium]MCM1401684.1 RNA polymerase factor sigma-54 [Bacteroides sp.]MCM1477539.1 RNA polymerase factor sigma-54 [Bacteroides sp.]
MGKSLNLQQELRQQQTLAPMQLQYVKMLEMNSPEVEDEVQRALDENPALETGDTLEETLPYTTSESHAGYRYPLYSGAAAPTFEPEPSESGESLMESLMGQLLQNGDLTPKQQEIARFIIGNIDPNGYLTRPLRYITDDIAITLSMDVTDDEVRHVWNLIRALDPAGIGAVDLRDSLLLQLTRMKPGEAVNRATTIVRDYFDVFSLMHYKQLKTMLGVNDEELKEAVDVIRSLNPKPGAVLGGNFDERSNQISPDFLVETDEGDRLTLSLLNNLPQLRISQSFLADTATPRKSASADQANAFIRQRRDEATGFIRALSMRQTTLFRVMSAIMQWQREFFLTDDPATLRPMILKDISGVTGDDVSVISRATAGKYVATAHGIYPLKFFFNEPRDGDDAASPKVMARIRELIENEDTSHPLTDQALTEILQKEGVNIARRTTAKYRERMNIPVGRLRKKL